MIKVSLEKFILFLWKKSTFFSQRQGRLYQIKNHTLFSKAGETAVLNCSFYLHSDDLYSVKWYKVNFFYTGLWSSHCLALSMTEWLDEHLIQVKLEGENTKTKEIADVDLLIDNLVTPCYKVDHRLFRAS